MVEVTQGHTAYALALSRPAQLRLPALGRDSSREGPPGIQGKANWEDKLPTAAPRVG